MSCTERWTRVSWPTPCGQQCAVRERPRTDCGGDSVVSELMRTGEVLRLGDVIGGAKM